MNIYFFFDEHPPYTQIETNQPSAEFKDYSYENADNVDDIW
jgi:hypothetical protein